MSVARQIHGLRFQDFICETYKFPSRKKVKQNSMWDVQKQHNHITNKPVSIKTAKLRTNVISLADVLKQYLINEDFEMVIGLWVPGEDGKIIVNIVYLPIRVAMWRLMWGTTITEEALYNLHQLMHSVDYKNLTEEERQCHRSILRKANKQIRKGTDGIIIPSMHIGAANREKTRFQLRCQASITQRRLSRFLGVPIIEKKECSVLWGKELILPEIKID